MPLIPILPPEAEDKDYTITFPKEMVPYLENFFYPQKKKDGESLEEYIVRVLITYGKQVMKEEFKALHANQNIETLQNEMSDIENEVDTLTNQFL